MVFTETTKSSYHVNIIYNDGQRQALCCSNNGYNRHVQSVSIFYGNTNIIFHSLADALAFIMYCARRPIALKYDRVAIKFFSVLFIGFENLE